MDVLAGVPGTGPRVARPFARIEPGTAPLAQRALRQDRARHRGTSRSAPFARIEPGTAEPRVARPSPGPSPPPRSGVCCGDPRMGMAVSLLAELKRRNVIRMA